MLLFGDDATPTPKRLRLTSTSALLLPPALLPLPPPSFIVIPLGEQYIGGSLLEYLGSSRVGDSAVATIDDPPPPPPLPPLSPPPPPPQ